MAEEEPCFFYVSPDGSKLKIRVPLDAPWLRRALAGLPQREDAGELVDVTRDITLELHFCTEECDHPLPPELAAELQRHLKGPGPHRA